MDGYTDDCKPDEDGVLLVAGRGGAAHGRRHVDGRVRCGGGVVPARERLVVVQQARDCVCVLEYTRHVRRRAEAADAKRAGESERVHTSALAVPCLVHASFVVRPTKDNECRQSL
jgi:hypothetical protein